MMKPLHSSYCLLAVTAAVALPTLSTAFTSSPALLSSEQHCSRTHRSTCNTNVVSSPSSYYDNGRITTTKSPLYMSSTLNPPRRNRSSDHEDKEKKKKYSSFLKRITKIFQESPSEEEDASENNIHDETELSSSSSTSDLSSDTSSSSTTSSSSSEEDTTKRRSGTTIQKRPSNVKPPNLMTAKTLPEFKVLVADEKERMVVVRWHATYCRACKAVQSSFYRLADIYPDIKFVEVPCSDKNVMLHQGLGVPTVPFAHIYHPDAGLVEEMKMSKRHFKKFSQILKSYVQGSCDTPDGDSTSPYPSAAPKEGDHHPQDGTVLKF